MVFEAQVCPNCGAPRTLVGNQCVFCKMPLAAVPDASSGAVATAPPPPPAAASGDPAAPFAMRVDDVFAIRTRGTVATGRIDAGTLHVGDRLVIDGAGGTVATEVTAIEMFRKTLDSASVGDNVGLMLKDVDKGQVAAGDWLRSA